MPALIHYGHIPYPRCGYMLMSKDMIIAALGKPFVLGRVMTRPPVFSSPPEALVMKIRVGSVSREPPKGGNHSRKYKKAIRQGKGAIPNPEDHKNSEAREIGKPVFARLERSWLQLAFQWVDDDGKQIGEDVWSAFVDVLDRMRYLVTLVDARTYRVVTDHNETAVLDAAHALVWQYDRERAGKPFTAAEKKLIPDCSDWRSMGLLQPLYKMKIAHHLAKGYATTAKESIPAAELEREIKEYSAKEKSKDMKKEMLRASDM